MWTHFVASELKPELLDGIPCSNGKTASNVAHQNGDVTNTASKPTPEVRNFVYGLLALYNSLMFCVLSLQDPDSPNDIASTENPDNTNNKVANAECSNNEENDAISTNEDSMDKSSITHINTEINNDDDVTNDSVITSDSATNDSVEVDNKQENVVLDINEETCSSFLEPPNKKVSYLEIFRSIQCTRNLLECNEFGLATLKTPRILP